MKSAEIPMEDFIQDFSSGSRGFPGILTGLTPIDRDKDRTSFCAQHHCYPGVCNSAPLNIQLSRVVIWDTINQPMMPFGNMRSLALPAFSFRGDVKIYIFFGT